MRFGVLFLVLKRVLALKKRGDSTERRKLIYSLFSCQRETEVRDTFKRLVENEVVAVMLKEEEEEEEEVEAGLGNDSVLSKTAAPSPSPPY